ncbi:unnamed protein product [Trichobilharzia szidati]|nr:unnamed protein product [Trichobilharzia szidati]
MSVTKVPPHLTRRLVSHGEKVCQLYKAVLYDLKSKSNHILKYRYNAVLARARFDENKDIKDEVLARKLLEDGWAELNATKHPHPFTYPTSPAGAAYERNPVFNDAEYDMWHPLEKQQYPDYFARREKRKKEFIDAWVKRYGAVSEK